jgi:hypothetical protein
MISKARKHILQIGGKFCIQQTIISKRKKNKKRRLRWHDMKTSTWTRGLANSRREQEEEELNFEPMLDYKYPNIASGATPIGSAERAPDRR